MDNQFTYIQFCYNLKQKSQTSQKEISVNPKILEIAKKIIFTKIIYDKNKKS
jgi:hypothetical protein